MAKMERRLTKSRSLHAIILLFLLFSLSVSFSSFADHPDEDAAQCPDTESAANGDVSVFVRIKHTGQTVTDGMVLEPIDENENGEIEEKHITLEIDILATASGFCQRSFYDTGTESCIDSIPQDKDVAKISLPYAVYSEGSLNSDDLFLSSDIFGLPVGSSHFVVDTTNPATSTSGTITKTINSAGSYKIGAKNFITLTSCDTAQTTKSNSISFTFKQLDEDTGCDKDDKLRGNPCNVATGNKYQVETDYKAPEISFTRYYNSQLYDDVGLGFNWTSDYHKKLGFMFNGDILYRQGNSRGSSFNKSGNDWLAEADSEIQLTEDGTGYDISFRDGSHERYDLNGRLVSMTAPTGQVTTMAYNTENQLASVSDAFGHVLQFTYDSSEHLETLTDPDGKVYQYTYDSKNNATSITFPDTTFRTYHYENAGEPHGMTGITDENGDRYANFDYVSGRATLTEHAITTNSTGQEKLDFSYNTAQKTTTVTDNLGTQIKYTFEENLGRKNFIQEENLVDNKISTQDFDARNNLIEEVNETGRITKHTYNASNQKTSTTDAFGTPLARTTTYEYLSPTQDLITKVISPSVFNGHTAERILAYADPTVSLPTYVAETGYQPDGTPVVRETSMTYTSNGQLLTIDGPREDVSDVTTYDYYICTTGNECGRVKTITNALGQVTTFNSYDAHGRVKQSTDPNGIISDTIYDLRGQITSVTLTAPNQQSRAIIYTYDNLGQLKTITFPSGYGLTNTFDAAHDLRKVEDNLGNYIDYLYDANGNRTDEKRYDSADVLKRHIDLSHDIRDREQSRTQGTFLYQTLYNAIGELDSSIDPGATPSISQWIYDELGRQDNMTDALDQLIDFDYDVKDNLTQVVAANGATTIYTYGDLGNRLTENSPDAGNQSFSHDSAGNITQKIDGRGLTTIYQYDALNRLTTITYNDNSQAVFQYDSATNGIGKLHSITDVSGTTTYSYTSFGELNTKTQIVGGQSFIVTYNYDTNGLLDTLQYPSGMIVDYNYTSNQINNVLIGTQSLLTNVSYDPFGHITGWTWANGSAVTREYDLGGFPSRYSLKSKIHDVTYDDRAQITALKDASDASVIQSFDYDALYRITDYNGFNETRTFGYDANGNRTSESLNTTNFTTSVATNSNRIQSTTGPVAKTFTYDGAGNTVNDGINSYAYDDRNRLRSVNNDSQGYLISALGQRVMKYDNLTLGDANNDGLITLADVSLTADRIVGKTSVPGNADCTNDGNVTVHDIVCINNLLASPPNQTERIHFVYDEAGHLIGEYDLNGAVIKEYIWLQDIPVAVRENNTTYNIYTDHLTTPREITDTNGTLIWQWQSDPFGVAQPNEDPDNNSGTFTFNLRFPGQYYDAETGLHYNYFRDYDPSLGRYVESDPIGLDGGINTYLYARANPIERIDPRGESDISTTISGLGAASLIVPVPGARIVGGILIGLGTLSLSGDTPKQCDACPPCRTISGKIVPIGTIGYRPLDMPTRPQHGIDGSHHNILKANQIPKGNPVGECDCFWQPVGAVRPQELPAGAIPAEPFLN